MAEDEAAKSPGDRFPALKPLEETVEEAKLRQALAEANAATLKSRLPSFDGEVQHDTIVMSDKTSGLARVLVQLDSLTLADDIADRALDAARAATSGKRSYVFRVVIDPAVLKDIDAYRLLRAQRELLKNRVDSYAPRTAEIREMIAPGVAAALVGVGIQGVGYLTKLLSREYTLSGTPVAVDDLGLDLEIAHALQAKVSADEEVRVEVERVMPTPETSAILADIRQLADDADQRVGPKITEAAGELELVTADVEATQAEISAIDTRIVELLKRIPDTSVAKPSAKSKTSAEPPLLEELRRLNTERTALRDGLTELRQTLATKREAHKRGTALLADIAAFVTAAFTANGASRAPALQAARGEALLPETADENQFLLYARLIAGGIDQEVERKLGSDRYLIVAGATAEFALLDRLGKLLASKVLSLMEASTMKLGDADSFRRQRMNYMTFDRAPTENGGRG